MSMQGTLCKDSCWGTSWFLSKHFPREGLAVVLDKPCPMDMYQNDWSFTPLLRLPLPCCPGVPGRSALEAAACSGAQAGIGAGRALAWQGHEEIHLGFTLSLPATPGKLSRLSSCISVDTGRAVSIVLAAPHCRPCFGFPLTSWEA